MSVFPRQRCSSGMYDKAELVTNRQPARPKMLSKESILIGTSKHCEDLQTYILIRPCLLTKATSRYSIENPLVHLTPEQLQRDVRAFARSKGLEEHLDVLKKGAQIAKDPRYYETIPGVTEYEKQALRDERARRFRQPLALYLTIIICSIGAAVQ